jgi:hypothetical protein
MVGIIGDWVGQLGENGEYWVGRKGSGLIWYSELQGGSPHLSRLRTMSFESCWTSIWMYWRIRNIWNPQTETEAILPYLTDVKWDSTWATHGVSAEAYAWKMCTRVRWALIVSLTSSWNCCNSRCPLGLCVSCCQVYTLARLIIDSDLRDTLGHGWWLVPCV